MSESSEWTIGKLLEWTKDYLTRHGSESARLDAEVLLAHANGCKRIELYTSFDEVASEALRSSFRELVRQRAEGTPVAYLVESREFYSLPFYVNPAVLIPRPETEFLLIRLLDLAKNSNADELRVLDVGTGSGILAICAALYLPNSRVVATDISPDALEVAGKNAASHQVDTRIDFRNGDLLNVCQADERFDFIISNPPYVSTSEFEQLEVQVRSYEPRQALLAGPQGTDVIERLISDAAAHLADSGWLLMEISPMILARVEGLLREHAFGNIRVTKDLAKLPRIVGAQLANEHGHD